MISILLVFIINIIALPFRLVGEVFNSLSNKFSKKRESKKIFFSNINDAREVKNNATEDKNECNTLVTQINSLDDIQKFYQNILPIIDMWKENKKGGLVCVILPND